jgi:hypothetical protein
MGVTIRAHPNNGRVGPIYDFAIVPGEKIMDRKIKSSIG